MLSYDFGLREGDIGEEGLRGLKSPPLAPQSCFFGTNPISSEPSSPKSIDFDVLLKLLLLKRW